ncbi:MAG: helix-turn-helix domain-containing protein [Armatimonadota bacterium]
MRAQSRFGRRLRELREQRRRDDPRFSLRQFAQALGVSGTYISRMELGEISPPNAERIKQMAQVLEIDPTELLSLADRVDPEVAEVVKARPALVGKLLRTARDVGATDAELQELIQKLEEMRRPSPTRKGPQRG